MRCRHATHSQQARITLARAVYSNAQILLLDDVLSALDVHTAKWIVDNCFRGSLVRGRTVLLVTHNVALVAPCAGYSIELSPDGQVIRQGSIDSMLGESSLLQADAQQDQESMGKPKQPESESTTEELSKGKLIAREEIALGRVAWPAIKLYTSNFGFFWVYSITGYTVAFGLNALSVWFLGYWASQYGKHEQSPLPVARSVPRSNSVSYIATDISAFSGYMR